MKRVGVLWISLGLIVNAHGQVMVPGGHGVSPSGAATYTIPIQVPPGLGGIEPKLALEYNSQSGNGLLGVGWRLSGLSSITRCPQSNAQDGSRVGVTFSSNDRFCLDGRRLMLVSGAYGEAASTYQTEIETFQKVTASGVVSSGTGPLSFSVKTKDGLTLQYGVTDDSRIPVSSVSGTVRVWALNQIADVKGNYLTISYKKDCTDNSSVAACNSTFNGGYYADEIAYTGNSTQTPNIAPIAKVKFNYDFIRADVRAWYQAGYKFVERARLVSIVTKANGADVLKYDVSSYELGGDTGRNRLKQIKVCDGAGVTCLPATTMSFKGASLAAGPVRSAFTQSTGDVKLLSASANQQGNMIQIGPDASWLVGDFRGIGRSDLLHVAGNGFASLADFYLWQRNDNGSFTPVKQGVIIPNYPRYPEAYYCDYGRQDQFPSLSVVSKIGAGDVDGDTIADLIWTRVDYEHKIVDVCKYDYWNFSSKTKWLKNNGGSIGGEELSLSSGPAGSSTIDLLQFRRVINPVPFSWDAVKPPIVKTGSAYFDAYGRLEIDALHYDSWGSYSATLNGRTFNLTSDNPNIDLTSENPVKGFSMDVDGDGLQDLFRVKDGTYVVWKQTRTFSGGLTHADSSYSGSVVDSSKGTITSGFSKGQWLTADLNGDGLTDLIHIPQKASEDSAQSGNLQWWINKGNGQFVANAAPFVTDVFAPQAGSWQVMDYNGDGQADLIHLADESAGKIFVWSYNGTGFTVSQMPAGSGAVDAVHSGAAGGLWKAADFVGDGVIDLVHFVNDSGKYVVWSMPRPDQDVVVSINNGLGKVVTFITNTLPKMLNKDATNGGSYTRDTPTGSPARTTTLTPAMQVVTVVEVSNGIGSTQKIGYNYDSMRVDRVGRGLLGFNWVESVEHSTGLTTRTTFSQTFPYVGMPIKVTSGTSHAKPDNLSLRTYTTNAYCQTEGTTKETLDTSTVCAAVVTGDGKRRYYPYVSASLAKAWDLDGAGLPQTSTDYTGVDSYGNIQLVKTSTLAADGAATAYSKQTDYTFYNDSTNWMLGTVVKKVDTATGPDLPTVVVPGSGSLAVAPPPITPQERLRKISLKVMPVISAFLLD